MFSFFACKAEKSETGAEEELNASQKIFKSKNFSPEKRVEKFLKAVKEKDFKTIFAATYYYQMKLSEIKSSNPKVLWEKLTTEYYESEKNAVIKGEKKSSFFGSTSHFTFIIEPTKDIRALMNTLNTPCKWKVIETTRKLMPDVFSGRQYDVFKVYVSLNYPKIDESPLINGKLLKKRIWSLYIDAKTGLYIKYYYLEKGDVYWENVPLRVLSVSWSADSLMGLNPLKIRGIGGVPPYHSTTKYGNCIIEKLGRVSKPFFGDNTTIFINVGRGGEWMGFKNCIEGSGGSFPLKFTISLSDKSGQRDVASFTVPEVFGAYSWVANPWYKWGQGYPNRYKKPMLLEHGEQLKIVSQNSIWVNKKISPYEVTIVPSITIKIKNIGKKPLKNVQYSGDFLYKDGGGLLGDGITQIYTTPLDPGKTSEEILIKSSHGYKASSKKAFITNKKKWKEIKVKVFARISSVLVKIGEYPIKQEIEGIKNIPGSESEEKEAEKEKNFYLEDNRPWSMSLDGQKSEEATISKYLQAMLHGKKGDIVTMSLMALEPVYIQYESYKIVSTSKPIIKEYELPKLLADLEDLKKQRKDQVKIALDKKYELEDLEDELDETRRASKKRELKKKIEEMKIVVKEEEQKVRDLQLKINPLKNEIKSEKNLIKLSSGVVRNPEIYKGETQTSKIDVKVTLKNGAEKDYVFVLKKYNLKINEDAEILKSRFVIIKIQTSEEFEKAKESEEEVVETKN